jgi:short-subunit dehydrogenase
MRLDNNTVEKLQKKSLSGKWALITGASRGIGQQIALGLAQHNCNLILHAREKEHLGTTLALIKNYPIKTVTVAGDLAKRQDIEKIIQEINLQSLVVDILYNNAAIMDQYKSIWEKTEEDWKAIFQVNLFGLIQLCTAFIPLMKSRNWGRVINLSSGIENTPQLSPYSVSKAAVDKYTRDLAAELRGTNVLVNYLDPGWLKTDLGGQQAPGEVSAVLPGAILPALLEDNGFSGELFRAEDYSGAP